MGLFTSSFPYDNNILEATVTNVDPQRFVCTVRTVKGQYFREVPWLLPTGGSSKNGVHLAPSVGDQVVVSTALTYPVILGALPRLGPPSTTLTSVSGSELSVDTGNNTNMKNGYVTNPAKPSDFVPGDHVITTEGGAVLAALLNGSIVARASQLAQIFISKFDDLVRIVARNFERMSDVGQQTAANVKGRLYEFMGWDRSLAKSKLGIYELQDVIGDVAAGEFLGGDPNMGVTPPAPDGRVRKYWFKDQNGYSRMVDVLYDNGKLTVEVKDAPGTTITDNITDKNLWQQTSTDPSSFSRVTITPASVTVTYNGEATTVHNSSGIESTFSGHFVRIDTSGVHLG